MDRNGRHEGPAAAASPGRDEGYRAGALIRDQQRGRTRAVAIAIAGIIGLSVLLSAVTNNPNGFSPLFGDLPSLIVPSDTPVSSLATPSALPRVGILGSPLPERPIPMLAGWLRWLDPHNGAFLGDAEPSDSTDLRLTFVDASGSAVQVCATQTSMSGSLVVSVDICAYGSDGTQRTHVPVLMLHPGALPEVDGLAVSTPFQLDATVSRDGRWLWVASSMHLAASWYVTISRVDLASGSPAGYRQIRVIPRDDGGLGTPSGEGWLVADSSTVRPVVRVSPDGARLSLTMTEVPSNGAPALGLLNQERVVLDSSLDPAKPIDVVNAVGTASDLACLNSFLSSAWATDTHYLTLCFHLESNGDLQPFVRIENPLYLTRDVSIGPAISTEIPFSLPSWLLDARRGVLYRWSDLERTLTSFDIATRAGMTTTIDAIGLPIAANPWPAADPGDGLLSWAGLANSPRLTGSADGSVLYALGEVSRGADTVTQQGPIVWAINAATGHVLGRWEAPGPIDQLGLAPGGGPLVGLVTPVPPHSGIYSDWTTQLWFMDARSGAPLEVLGEIRGPGYSSPTILAPAVAVFAGF